MLFKKAFLTYTRITLYTVFKHSPHKGGFIVKKGLLIFYLFSLLIFPSCHQDPAFSSESENAVEIIEMTDHEKALLKDLYIDEERVEQGKLYGYQKSYLMQLRFATHYLEEKYPRTAV